MGRKVYRGLGRPPAGGALLPAPRGHQVSRQPGPGRSSGGGLVETWSPEQVAERLRQDFPCDPMMWVSHETIYKPLFVQGRGDLRRELARCLRSGRTERRPAPARSGGAARPTW